MYVHHLQPLQRQHEFGHVGKACTHTLHSETLVATGFSTAYWKLSGNFAAIIGNGNYWGPPRGGKDCVQKGENASAGDGVGTRLTFRITCQKVGTATHAHLTCIEFARLTRTLDDGSIQCKTKQRFDKNRPNKQHRHRLELLHWYVRAQRYREMR